MARRVTVVRDYLFRELDVEMSEEEIIETLCPTAWRYEINKLNILINKNECLNSNCVECWNKEASYKR